MMNENLIKKAQQLGSAKELALFAQENGMPLSEEEAKRCFTQLHAFDELSDEELDAVAGGGCNDKTYRETPCPRCGKRVYAWTGRTGIAHWVCENCDYQTERQ